MDARYALSVSSLIVAFCLPALSTSAQGDSCATALLVTHGLHHADGPSTGEPGPQLCGSPGTHGDWYKYIATFTGTINITSCNTENEPSDDTYLNVYTGDCGALTCVGFNDDMGSNNCPGHVFATYLDIAVTTGETYYIVWGNMFSSDDFDWNLTECFGTVQGGTYNDANSNGVLDAGEQQVDVMLVVDPGGHFVYASQNPYAFCTEAGAYTISVPNPPLYYIAVPATHDYTVDTQGQLITGMDFAFQPIPGMYDGRADIWGWNPWIGNETTYNITYRNVGTEPLSGTIMLTLDDQTDFVSSEPAPASASGQTATWTVTDMPPGAIASITVTYHTDETALVTDDVTASVVFNITGTDQTPDDNSDAITAHPTTSFDPNEKLVDATTLSMADVADAKTLEYVVHFQNTGTAPAVNVVVRDVIDSDMDLSTFEMIGATHPYAVWIEGNEIEWTFANILLPDSSADFDASQGAFSYRITPKSTTLPGTQIENRADIYFDFNSAVLTNTVVTQVALAEGIRDAAQATGLRMHPSPSTGHVTIRWMDGDVTNARITVMDALGRAVYTTNISRLGSANGQVLDLSNLPEGTYAAWLQGDGVDMKTRFVIQH